MTSGFCLVLHAHQPYVRRHGAWPCGEDWYHQAAADAYLPLADAFARLAADGLGGLATVSITPVLAGQMADPYLTRELHLYLGRTMLRAQRQAANYRGADRDAILEVAAAAHRRAAGQAAWLEGAGAAGTHLPWRALGGAGVVELWTSAPTHAYLPGLSDEGLLQASLAAAADEHARVFDARPGGVWLPECGYRPGLEDSVARAGFRAMVVDGPAFEAAGAALDRPVRAGTSEVAAFARDRALSLLVSGPGGYPGGPAYRDFHHHDAEAGFKSFAVTGREGPKRPYDASAGEAAAREDGRRFAAEVERRLAAARAQTGRHGVLVAAFDLELFGHWWFEGPAFLEAALRALSRSRVARPMTLGAALERFPPDARAALPESSWGRDGDGSSWVNPATAPAWGRVRAAEARLRAGLAGDVAARAQAQAVREFLLLASSDWPYMVTMGRAADYARDRLDGHDRAFGSLCDALERGEGVDEPELAALEERDNLLPGLDPAAFRTSPMPQSPA